MYRHANWKHRHLGRHRNHLVDLSGDTPRRKSPGANRRRSQHASQAQVEAAQRRAIAVEDNLAQALKLLAQSQNATTPLQSLATPDPSGRPAVGWDLQRRGTHAYLLRNWGASTATGVHLERKRTTAIVRNLPENATVRPGESLQFLMVPTFGHPLPGEVWVKWDGQAEPMAVPLPR